MQSIKNTEATNPPVVPAEGTEAMEGCEVPIKSSEVPTDMAESLDIEAELDKREARSKKFGTSFDRESCRQQLVNRVASSCFAFIPLRKLDLCIVLVKIIMMIIITLDCSMELTHSVQNYSQNVEPSSEWWKPINHWVEDKVVLGREGMNSASQELLAERQKKFGMVEKSFPVRPRGEKRYQPRYRNQKNRRYM